jgi:predicted PurR-regulated permease PerM
MTITKDHEDKSSDFDAKTSHVQKNGHQERSLAKGVQLNILIGLAIVAFLFFARSVILPIIIAFIAAMVLKPSVFWLSRWHIPPALSSLLIIGAFFCATAFGFLELSQPAMKWVNNAPQNLEKLRARGEKLFPTEKFKNAVNAVNVLGASPEEPGKPPPVPVQVKEPGKATETLTWTGGMLAGIVETIVLLYMFLVLGDDYLQKILDASDTAREKNQILKISREVQKIISGYMFTVSIINGIFGALVGVGLFFLGIPNAALWGVLAAFLNYIPYFGPIIGIIIVGLVGVVSDGSIARDVLPAIWYLLLHVLEADLVTPILLGRQFTVSPLIVFISLLFWVWLWGPLGALLSMPLLMTIKVIFREIPQLSGVAKFL